VSVIFLLIIVSIVLAGSFLVAFWFALKKNQFEDLTTPAMRILFDDDEAYNKKNIKTNLKETGYERNK